MVSNTEYTEISSGVLGDYIFLTIIHGLGERGGGTEVTSNLANFSQ